MQHFQRTESDTPISPRFVKLAMAAERYVLPWFFAFLAYQRIGAIQRDYRSYRMLKEHSAYLHANDPVLLNIAAATLTKDILLALLMAFAGITLLFSRRPVALPDKLKHVLIPLAMSYYFLLYGIVDSLPALFRENLLPPRFQGSAAVGGLILGIIGHSVAIWAMVHLGRSFAVLVSVRKIVSSGPYAYVRHPIYLGYAIDLCGLLLATSSIAMLTLAAGWVVLLIIRARIEEEMLSEADEGYRQYVTRTSFLFPRSFKPLR
jgi:protein-S-isoprenylcysteine O-methyltransferase Ste14